MLLKRHKLYAKLVLLRTFLMNVMNKYLSSSVNKDYKVYMYALFLIIFFNVSLQSVFSCEVCFIASLH